MIYIHINSNRPEKEKVRKAAEIIRNGGIVIFPTDTVYGIGARADRARSLYRVYYIKKREKKKPFILFIRNKNELKRFARGIPGDARGIIRKFWPGAITLVFRASAKVKAPVRDSRGTVGIRIPGNIVMLRVLGAAGVPFATTSANISGQRSPVKISDIPLSMLAKADLVIDGGKCPAGKPSTVLDLTVKPFRMLREGAVSLKQLKVKSLRLKVDPRRSL